MTAWRAADIGDLSGRRAVVTGANGGLGFETASELAAHGATVVLACRSTERGEQALRRIRSVHPDADVELAKLDLADLTSIRRMANDCLDRHGALDLLVNNAGLMAIPRAVTADGFEMQFGVNHLGHFALTGLLLPAMLTRRGARVVTVSSMVAHVGRIRFDDLQGERRYQKWTAYAQAKLANLLFAFELDRRASAGKLGLVSVAAHPGYAATQLQAQGPELRGSRVGVELARLGNRVFAHSAAQGALPSLYGATAAGVEGGTYFGPSLLGMRGGPGKVSPPRASRDPDVARRLWQVSEQATGVHFGALNPSY